jgi:mono/diheme cytochrome c family protein
MSVGRSWAARARVGGCLTVFLASWAAAQGVAAQGVAAPGSAAPTAVAKPAAVPVPTLDAAAAIELGRRTYLGMCARCHGINLVTQGIGYDLRKFPQDEQARFNRSVTQGIRAMPALGANLSPAQLEGLWAYIGSVNGWKPR